MPKKEPPTRGYSSAKALLYAGLFSAVSGLSFGVLAAEAPNSLYNLAARWTDDSGKSVSLNEWKGKPVIITMAYSTCRKTCSITLRKLEVLQAALDRNKQDAEIVIVSYDPKNDTPRTWSEYRKQRGLQRNNWHFLTGDRQGTTSLSRMLGLADFWSYDGHILHDFKISVLNRSGVIEKQIGWQDLNVNNVF
jgi:protein SCO1